MSGRFLVLLLLLAVLVTAATYLYTTEKQETVTDPGLSDVERRATVHGWPWGYYAEIREFVPYSEQQVAIFEYKEWYFEQFGQTYLVWFIALLVLGVVFVLFATPSQKRV
jgi:hypothetical protein